MVPAGTVISRPVRLMKTTRPLALPTGSSLRPVVGVRASPATWTLNVWAGTIPAAASSRASCTALSGMLTRSGSDAGATVIVAEGRMKVSA